MEGRKNISLIVPRPLPSCIQNGDTNMICRLEGKKMEQNTSMAPAKILNIIYYRVIDIWYTVESLFLKPSIFLKSR